MPRGILPSLEGSAKAHDPRAPGSRVSPGDEEHVPAAALALVLVAQEAPQEGPAGLVRARVVSHEREDVAARVVALGLAAIAVVEEAEALAPAVRFEAHEPERAVPAALRRGALVAEEERDAEVAALERGGVAVAELVEGRLQARGLVVGGRHAVRREDLADARAVRDPRLRAGNGVGAQRAGFFVVERALEPHVEGRALADEGVEQEAARLVRDAVLLPARLRVGDVRAE